MGSLRAKLVDRNRFAKRYPLVRAPVRTTYMGDTDLAIEVGSLYFDNVDSGTLNFEGSFSDTNYQIIAMARSDGTDLANVNVYVISKSQTSVTVGASSIFRGYVDVFAVRIA